jgi:hypothetical protein
MKTISFIVGWLMGAAMVVGAVIIIANLPTTKPSVLYLAPLNEEPVHHDPQHRK